MAIRRSRCRKEMEQARGAKDRGPAAQAAPAVVVAEVGDPDRVPVETACARNAVQRHRMRREDPVLNRRARNVGRR